MKTKRKWLYWIRLLHDNPRFGCELYVYREGDRPGWDDYYVNTYRDKAEAEEYAKKLLEAQRNQEVDVGYGVKMILPE